MRSLLTTLLLSAISFSAISANDYYESARPSFDCRKAKTLDEKVICSDPELAELDLMVSRAYQTFTPNYQPKRAIGKDLLRARSACGSDRACIAAAQVNALETYATDGRLSPWPGNYARALIGRRAGELATHSRGTTNYQPNRLAECAHTRIKRATTRFGEAIADYSNDDAGTAISYENGLYQVSYGRESLHGLKAGQEVVICLMSIPRDCPNGDNRGRTYYVLNLATNTEWVLPDSQHFCGGA